MSLLLTCSTEVDPFTSGSALDVRIKKEPDDVNDGYHGDDCDVTTPPDVTHDELQQDDDVKHCSDDVISPMTMNREAGANVQRITHDCNLCNGIKMEPTDESVSESPVNSTVIQDYRADSPVLQDLRADSTLLEDLLAFNQPAEQPWVCLACGRSFKRRGMAQSHVYSHTNARPFSCELCDGSFKRQVDLNHHLRTDHAVNGHFSCDICSRTFKRLKYFKAHKSEPCDQKRFKCNECGRAFNISQHLKQHQLIHSGEKPFTCDQCGRSFTTKGAMKEHQFIHSGEKPFVCPICQRAFTTKGTMRQHTLTHSGQKPYKCHVCDKSFTTSSSLCSHKRIHGGEKKFVCIVCGKGFVKGPSLKEHMISHSGEKNHQCWICLEWFGTKSNLNRHILTHDTERERSCICSVCGDAFYDHHGLKNHMKVHSDEKPYKCSVCARGFKQYNNLKVHMRLHTGEKPYSCDICERTFTHDYSLKKHKLTHVKTSEKPSIQCQVCNKSFQFLTSYLEHQNLHTGQKPFSCNLCGESFSHRSKVSFHKRMVHNGGKTNRQVRKEEMVDVQSINGSSENVDDNEGIEGEREVLDGCDDTQVAQLSDNDSNDEHCSDEDDDMFILSRSAGNDKIKTDNDDNSIQNDNN